MWYIYTMEYYLALKKNKIMLFVETWVELEIVILSEVSQSEKDSRNKVHNNKAKQDVLVKYINNIIDGDLFEILDMKGNSILGVNRDDILSDDELIQYKLKIIIRKISFMNRGGRE